MWGTCSDILSATGIWSNKKGCFSFIQTSKLAESKGSLCAPWRRPGSNPGPWAAKRRTLPTVQLGTLGSSRQPLDSLRTQAVTLLHLLQRATVLWRPCSSVGIPCLPVPLEFFFSSEEDIAIIQNLWKSYILTSFVDYWLIYACGEVKRSSLRRVAKLGAQNQPADEQARLANVIEAPQADSDPKKDEFKVSRTVAFLLPAVILV